MPLLTPGRRWQKAYYPFKKRTLSERVEEGLERTIKGVLWGCRMCGNCLLQETAFICPMACPKGLRNGPCGGSTPENCCVDTSRPWIWYAIYQRAEKIDRLDHLDVVLPPLDWQKTGTSALMDVYGQIRNQGKWPSFFSFIRLPAKTRKQAWDNFFKQIRQPDWWEGDSLPHHAFNQEPVSKLDEALRSEEFVITCELVPLISDNFKQLNTRCKALRNFVDAINFTDNASAIPRVSSSACSLQAFQNGIEPIMQMAVRDLTRIGFQGDLIGASASGIRNILFISGDHPIKGTHPNSSMDIWDIDSIQAIWIARRMRDENILLDGRKIKDSPQFLISAAGSPFASKPKFQAIREEKKVNAGAQFIQTNMVFETSRFEEYLEALDQRSVLNRVHLIVGISLLRSVKAANFMRQIPGVFIPKWITD